MVGMTTTKSSLFKSNSGAKPLSSTPAVVLTQELVATGTGLSSAQTSSEMGEIAHTEETLASTGDIKTSEIRTGASIVTAPMSSTETKEP